MKYHQIKKIEEKVAELGKADLHIHSNFSDAKPSVEEILDYVQNKTDLDVIAISDHDTIKGALLAQELMKKKKYRFQLIIGEEVSTQEGHVIGLFLKNQIKKGLPAHEVIKKIKNQGGLALMAHPLRHVRVNTGNKNLDGLDLMTLLKEKRGIDAMEVINGTPTFVKDNLRAMFFNDSMLFKAEIGSSDAHILEAIGMGYTIFEGSTAAELKQAILSNQTRALNVRWGAMGLFKYLFFFLPKGLRLFVNTLLHGRRPKRIQLINIPKINLINHKLDKKNPGGLPWNDDSTDGRIGLSD